MVSLGVKSGDKWKVKKPKRWIDPYCLVTYQKSNIHVWIRISWFGDFPKKRRHTLWPCFYPGKGCCIHPNLTVCNLAIKAKFELFLFWVVNRSIIFLREVAGIQEIVCACDRKASSIDFICFCLLRETALRRQETLPFIHSRTSPIV